MFKNLCFGKTFFCFLKNRFFEEKSFYFLKNKKREYTA
jgi:hypothetical protein